MNQKISSFRIAMVVMLAVTLIVISAAAQSVVKTIIFNSPDITNNIGFGAGLYRRDRRIW